MARVGLYNEGSKNAMYTPENRGV